MSTFAVTVERIAETWPHANADRLELARVASMPWQFVIAKGQFRPGDVVVYLPIDSILPPRIIEALGLVGKLSGAAKNRVKTIRLRGEISQGLVATPGKVLPEHFDVATLREGQDVTELLGVIRYEPEPEPCQAGTLVPLPTGVSLYDIEGAERYVAQLERHLMDAPVLITEKLEGSHFAASLLPDGDVAVCQRRFRIQPITDAEHDWHAAARRLGLPELLPRLLRLLEGHRAGRTPAVVTVRGEMVGPGIQGNHYRLRAQELRVFEIEADGRAVPVRALLELTDELALQRVPVVASDVILREWLAGRTLAEASNAPSALNADVPREGLVIRPMIELRDEDLGRVILKQRSPAYLAGSEL
jgi:RNA ligase (TIGR02306 family)